LTSNSKYSIINVSKGKEVKKMIKIYPSDENIYVLELWGGSTKHPDSVYHMKDFKIADWVDKNDEEMVRGQVFQWLLECASKLNFPPHAEELAEFALRNWCTWREP
jgi:hypothetical protein